MGIELSVPFWDVAQRLVYYMFLQWHFTAAFFPSNC